MNLDLLITILPFAFAIHNLEEVFGMEKWTSSIPHFIHKPVFTKQFTIAVGLFTILGFTLTLTRNFYQTETQYLTVITAFSGMLFLNVFFPHLIATIYLKKYAPGIISGLIINLPLTTLIIRGIYHSQKLSTGQIFFYGIIGGLSGVALAYIFLKIGKYFDPKAIQKVEKE